MDIEHPKPPEKEHVVNVDLEDKPDQTQHHLNVDLE